jgi:WhiB family transcriptional regulator, redox-sensing transcriptional regulator
MRTIRISRPAWIDDATCRGGDPAVIAVFFARRTEAAKRICADCPSRRPCAEYAIAHPELEGVWGGLTDNDRDHIRRRTR